MGKLTFQFQTDDGHRELVHEFREEDSEEVDIALDALADGAGASFPVVGGRFVVPPLSTRWVRVEGLLIPDDQDLEVEWDDDDDN